MMKCCGVKGCKSTGHQDLYATPNTICPPATKYKSHLSVLQLRQLRQDAWIQAIYGKVDDETMLEFTKIQYVCGRHFVRGHPANLLNKDNVDWVPTLLMNNSIILQNTTKPLESEKLSLPEENMDVEIKEQIIVNDQEYCENIPSSKNEQMFCNDQYDSYVNVLGQMTSMHTMHSDVKKKAHPPKSKFTSPEILETAKIFECGVCSEIFSSLETTNAHIAEAHQANEEEQAAKNQAEIFECGFCAKQFETINSTNEHIEQHHTIKFCGMCSAEFLSQRDLTIHMSKAHKTIAEDVNDLELKHKNKQLMKKLFERLEKFNWCACNRCVMFCKLFSGHLDAVHVAAQSPNIVCNTQNSANQTHSVDDYFENTKLVEPASVCPPNDDTPKEIIAAKPSVINTNKKVLFKIKNVNDKKLYECMVCHKLITDHVQLMGHFKMHLIQQTEAVGDKITKASIVQGELPIKATILGPEMQPVTQVLEYQCSVCAEISNTRRGAWRCLRRHADNGWPVDVGIGDIWETFTESNEAHHTSTNHEMVEESDRTEHFEDNLKKIAADYQQSANLAVPTTNAEKIYYQCLPCKKYYDCRDAIAKHLSEIHYDTQAVSKDNEVKIRHKVTCLICQKNHKTVVFDNIKEAITHRHNLHFYTIDHSPAHPVTRYIVKPDETEIRVTGKMLYYPKECLVEEFQCVCDKVYDFKSLAEKCLAKHVGIRRFKCDREQHFNKGKCGLEFFSEHDLAYHVKRVHEDRKISPKPFMCHLCGLPFACKSLLLKHIYLKHSNRASRTCRTCGKIYSNVMRLNSHIRCVHRKEDKYSCKVCFKKYVWKTAADKCKAMHTGVRNFKCELCSKTFYTRPQKVSHRLIAHPKIEELTCDQCGYVALNSRQLKQHCEAKHYSEESD